MKTFHDTKFCKKKYKILIKKSIQILMINIKLFFLYLLLENFFNTKK